MRIEKKMG